MVCCDMTPTAELILFNGSLITCDDENQKNCTALAVAKGHICAMGNDQDILALSKTGVTRAIDLKKNCLIPGFIDCHSHFGKSLFLKGLPDVSAASDVSDVLEIMKQKFAQYPSKREGQILMAQGYDQSGLRLPTGKRHITCADLDAVFPNTAVGLFHFSLQGAVLNSPALKLLEIDQHTAVPAGGTITKSSRGELAGGIWHAALGKYSKKLMAAAMVTNLTLDDRRKLIHEAQLDYASYGYTTINDGNCDSGICEWLVELAKDKRIFLDIVALPNDRELDSTLSDLKFNTYNNKVKFGGIKLVVDGPVQTKNAYMGTPYTTSLNGTTLISAPDLNRSVKRVVDSGLQVYAQCHGDEALDAYINALEMAGVKANNGRRHVVLNGTVTRDDQQELLKRYNMVASYMSNGILMHGDSIASVVTHEKLKDLCPMKSSMDKGITVTNHTDYPLSPLSPMVQIHTSVNRKTRNNRVIGADESLDVCRAIKALTINAAKQNHEETIKGSISIGKLADFVVLSKDPRDVPYDKLQHIKVQMTFKDGVEVFNRRKIPAKRSSLLQKERLFTANQKKAACV